MHELMSTIALYFYLITYKQKSERAAKIQI